MIYGRKVVVNSKATHLQGLMVYQGTQPLFAIFFRLTSCGAKKTKLQREQKLQHRFEMKTR